MITITTVEKCPYTVAGTGVVRLAHDVIATLAGAVHDSIEWMAILEGTRSADGLDITVIGLRVPKQTRNSVNCEFDKPEPLGVNDVGVVHSHHNMSAVFSATDHNELNPRFPFSIVVAQSKAKDSDAENLLGFSYSAEGRASLPCGSNGIIKFTAEPYPMVDGWPEETTTGFAKPNEKVSLHECPHNERKFQALAMVQTCTTKCGITSTSKAKAIFGKNGKQFIKEVEKNTVAHKWHGHGSIGQGGQVYPIVVDNRQAIRSDGYKQRDWERDMYRADGSWKHWSDF